MLYSSSQRDESLDAEDNDDEGLWVARVKSMGLLQVNQFKEFVKRRNGKAQLESPNYSFARRLEWMLMKPLRRELAEYTLKLDLALPLTPQNPGKPNPGTSAHPATASQQRSKPKTYHNFGIIEMSDSEEENIKPTKSELKAHLARSQPSTLPPPGSFPTSASAIEISDDSTSSHEHVAISSRKRKRKPVKAASRAKRRAHASAPPPESSDVDLVATDHSFSKEKGKGKDAGIPITRLRKVERVVDIDHLPSYYPIQDGLVAADIAYLVQTNGPIKNDSMEAALKDKDLDSWGNGKGTSMGSKDQKQASTVPLLDGKARCSRLLCQGVLMCEHFRRLPGVYTEGFTRTQADGEVWAGIERAEMERKRGLQKNTTYWSGTFVRSFMGVRCTRKGCDGTPIIRNRRKEVEGWFVGCSKWKNREVDHMAYFPYESADRELVQRMIAGEVVDNVPEGLDYCFNQYSPRSGRSDCAEVHFVDGRLNIGKLVKLECPVRRISYTPYNDTKLTAVIIFENEHNHPGFPDHKLTVQTQKAVDDAYEANGYGAITAGKLNQAQSTRAITGGLTLQEANPSLQNRRHIRTATKRAIAKKYVHGAGWEGVVHAMIEQEALPREERYIWTAQLLNNVKIIVTMLPSLAPRLHDAQEIVCDFTFKRVFGEMNEWEVAVWDQALEMRLTVARIYSNATNTAAFTYLWKAFFDSVKSVTGRSIELQMLHGRGSIAFVVDAEAAQALGLAYALMTLPGVKTSDWKTPEDILPYVLITCRVHFTRNLHKLRGEVTKEEYELLSSITLAATQEGIDKWEAFCRQSGSKRVKDWFENKIQHSWYIPSLNPLKTKIRLDLWSVVRHDSNIVESAHVSTNDVTGTGLPLLHAIERARAHDEEVASTIEARMKTGIRPALHNTDIDRTRTRNRRQMKAHLAQLRNTRLEDALESLKSQTQKNKDEARVITRRTKELLTRGKDMSEEQLIKFLEFAAPSVIPAGEEVGEAIMDGDAVIQFEEPEESYFLPHVEQFIGGLTEEAFEDLAKFLLQVVQDPSLGL